MGKELRAAVATGLVALAAGAASAQETEPPAAGLTLGTMTISALRTDLDISQIPASVAVIDRATLDRELRSTGDLARVLERLVPGYQPANQTMSGASETLRGRDYQVVVNGVSRNTPLRNTNRILSLIDPSTIERIEVINGASSVRGSGATGGIINIVTRRGESGVSAFTAETGFQIFTADPADSFAPEATFTYEGGTDRFDVFGSVRVRDTGVTYDGDGQRLPSDPLLGQGGSENWTSFTASGVAGLNFDAGRLELSVDTDREDQSPDFFTDYTVRPIAPDWDDPYDGESVTEEAEHVALRWEDPVFALGNFEVVASYSSIDRMFSAARLSAVNPAVYYSGNPADPFSDDGQTQQLSEVASLEATVTSPLDMVREGTTLTWGLDLAHETAEQQFIDGVDAIAPMEQTSYAAFAQADVPVTDWLNVRAGVRYDRFHLSVDDFTRPSYVMPLAGCPLYPGPLPCVGDNLVEVVADDVIGGDFTYDAWTFNLGAVVRVTEAWDLFGGFSQGFSLPDVGSFTRRAGLNTQIDLVTPQVIDYSSIGPEPQLVNTYQLGIRGGGAVWDASLTGFVSTSDEGTNFDPQTNTIVQQEELVYGVEFVGSYDVSDAVTVGTALSWTEGERDTDGDGSLDAYLPNNRIATTFKGSLYAEWRATDWLDLGAEGVYYGGRDRDDGSSTWVEIEDAFTMNLSASADVLGGDLGIGVENLLDATYESPTGTATRNIPVNAYGRTVLVRYRRTF